MGLKAFYNNAMGEHSNCEHFANDRIAVERSKAACSNSWHNSRERENTFKTIVVIVGDLRSFREIVHSANTFQGLVQSGSWS